MCSGGSEPAVSQLYKFLIISLLIISTSQLQAEEVLIPMPEVSQEMLKQVGEVVNSVQKVQSGPKYQEHRNWINNNKQELFARQGERLPTIDYGISKEQLEKDTIAKMLNSYRFQGEDLKKVQITHFPLMIFVSSSIPKSSLKDLMIQSKRAGGVLVFRGMIGGLKNTAKFLENLYKENVQAIIDPRLFDLFNIEVVPTIVVLKEATQNCDSTKCQTTPIHDRISGNITLEYALETFVNGQTNISPIAEKFLTALRKQTIEGGESNAKK